MADKIDPDFERTGSSIWIGGNAPEPKPDKTIEVEDEAEEVPNESTEDKNPTREYNPKSFGAMIGKNVSQLMTHDLNEIFEPNWNILIPDQINFTNPEAEGALQIRQKINLAARSAAHQYWENIIHELRENETLTLNTLDMAKRLVLAKVRIDIASGVLFVEGFQVYDLNKEHMRLSLATGEIEAANRMCVLLEDKMGLTPEKKNKVGKSPLVTKRDQRGSNEFLASAGSNVQPLRRK